MQVIDNLVLLLQYAFVSVTLEVTKREELCSVRGRAESGPARNIWTNYVGPREVCELHQLHMVVKLTECLHSAVRKDIHWLHATLPVSNGGLCAGLASHLALPALLSSASRCAFLINRLLRLRLHEFRRY